MTTSVLWFRRDLRLADHPALLAACDAADDVLPLFVLDDRLRGPSGAPRLAFLYGCLRDLEQRTDGRLRVVTGRPVDVVPRVAREVGARSVHISADTGPYGRARDAAVEAALDGTLVRTGSPYAVTPGRLVKGDGTPYRVYTPFRRAWEAHGWRGPATTPEVVPWTDGGLPTEGVPADPDLGGTRLPMPGENAARALLDPFLSKGLAGYQQMRDLPAVQGTSRLSAYLKYGCVHPRTLLDALTETAGSDSAGAATFRGELAWRDFYADVLWHRPDTAREDYRPELGRMEHDEGPVADAHFDAWAEGRTGFPIVDAGMRQLLGEAYVHNRVRMIVASFLVKDLHLPWQRGARHFLQHLVDGDLASNNHGWQWIAGTGTDAAPYFRVFNPLTQGRKFDPDGDYVRRWVPELRGIPSRAVHEPWLLPGGPPDGYPVPVVDHAAERREALARYAAARS